MAYKRMPGPQQRKAYIGLTDAAALCPGNPDPCSLWRWARFGLRLATGERIKLHVYRAGARLWTTETDLRAFLDALTAADAARFGASDHRGNIAGHPGVSSPIARSLRRSD